LADGKLHSILCSNLLDLYRVTYEQAVKQLTTHFDASFWQW